MSRPTSPRLPAAALAARVEAAVRALDPGEPGELACITGLCPATISQLRNRRSIRRVSVDTLVRLEAGLEIMDRL